jgi:two-component system phosphate regulon sensor histidine kinase PhoR
MGWHPVSGIMATLKNLLDALPFPALVVGPDEHLAAINAAAQTIFGPAAEGRHHVTIFRQPALLHAIAETNRDGQARSTEFLTTEAKKDLTWVVHVRAIKGEGFLLTFEDRTATEEAGQMRRDFVANVSHELKTPLTALIGFIDTIRGAAKNDPAAQARFLDIMANEAGRMNRLVTDLMSLSRVEAEERRRPTEPVNLCEQAKSALRTLTHLAETHQIDLRAGEIFSDVVIPGDADQIAQVITNLVENAIKYSGAGNKVTLSVKPIGWDTLIGAPAAILKVQDTGPGIRPEVIPRLTERFYRVDDHRSRELGGTGLGLAIVKHIVNRHRGRLVITSELGQGADFSVILPLIAP